MSYRELLIGCGNDLRKKVVIEGSTDWSNLTTLDNDPDCKPDILHDLDVFPYPFEADTFDEIHAIEVLEHCGHQGDVRYFFDQFNEFYRILKPGGLFVATVPMWDSPWAWSDPGHRRVITRYSLVFLSDYEYEQQVGKTPMADYRRMKRCNFEVQAATESEHQLGFILKALK